jgi:hypothetical protein
MSGGDLTITNLYKGVNRSGSMIEAGSETTSQALNNTIIGLLPNPGAIKKGQEELDRVIGPERTPTFEDEKSLPYIRAIVKVPTPPLSRTIANDERKHFDGVPQINSGITIMSLKMIGMKVTSLPKTQS